MRTQAALKLSQVKSWKRKNANHEQTHQHTADKHKTHTHACALGEIYFQHLYLLTRVTLNFDLEFYF